MSDEQTTGVVDEHAEALALLLAARWKNDKGFLVPPADFTDVPSREWDAAHYLCDEWNYEIRPWA